MYPDMYVCMYTDMYVCMYTDMYVCMYTDMYVCMYTDMYVCIQRSTKWHMGLESKKRCMYADCFCKARQDLPCTFCLQIYFLVPCKNKSVHRTTPQQTATGLTHKNVCIQTFLQGT